MNTATLIKVVQHVRNTACTIEQGIGLFELSAHYHKTLCGCDPLARVYDADDRCIVDYLFYELQGNGSFVECPDPRMYVEPADSLLVGPIEHVCPSHRQCLSERSGLIDDDEYDEECLLLT